jgi:putative transposase
VTQAWDQVSQGFERFCLTAGLNALGQMMDQDATQLCGPRYGHRDGRSGHRWGKTRGRIGFHGGTVSLDRPRLRGRDAREMTLPSWEAAQSEDLPGRRAMSLMLINVSTRRFARRQGTFPRPQATGCRNPPSRAASWRCPRHN